MGDPIVCPTCHTTIQPGDRCPAERGSARCMELVGHDGFHWSDVGASPAVLVWFGPYVARRCPGRLDPNTWCVKQPGHDRGHNDGHGRSWAEADVIEVCPTCANSGWIGSRHDPTDCPTCGRKPYWLVGDGTYPSPVPAADTATEDQT